MQPECRRVWSRQAGMMWRMMAGCWLVMACLLRAATPEETQAFDAAARQLEDGLYEQASKSFGEFLAKYPGAERVGEATTLKAHAEASGLLQRNDAAGAAAAFAKIQTDFTNSPHRLEAVLGEATARFRLGEFARVGELLTGAALKPVGAAKPAEERVVRGVLMLAEARLLLDQSGPGLEAMQTLAPLALPPVLTWQRQYLLARLQVAGAQLDAALGTITNLVGLSTNALHVAEAHALQGGVLERLGRADEAILAFEKNLGEGIPAARRREAQAKVVQLLVARNRVSDAIKRIEGFLAQPLTESPGDVLRVTLGELRLKEYYALAPEARKAGTNLLGQVLGHAEFVLTNTPASEWVPRAHWSRGWCLWELAQAAPERLGEAMGAFRAAAEKLPAGEEQAMARFKWADCQFLAKDYAGAVSNYWGLIEQYAASPAVKGTLFDQALYQVLRAGIELNDMAGADKALQRIFEWFPDSFFGDRSLLLFGQALTGRGQPAEARARFGEFVKRFPSSSLLPEARRAISRTYVQEGNWAAALGEIEGWLGAYPENPGRAEGEFERAWLCWQTGRTTNAFLHYTNFVARFPTHALAPQAQLWIADQYFDQGDFAKAELNYQILFQNTNWAGSGLAVSARLLAGRAAFGREGYDSAKGYFLWLITNAPAGDPIVAEALFDYGNTLVARPATEVTNALANFEEAINAFTRVTQQHATNRLAPMAWGRIGDCHFQLATADPLRYQRATNAYARVLESAAGLAVRSKAEVGLGAALEKMAALADGPDREALLQQALDHNAAVLYEKNRRPGETEPADPLWVRDAGLAAARIAEGQQRWEVAIKIYQRLMDLYPPLRLALEKRAKAAEAHRETPKT